TTSNTTMKILRKVAMAISAFLDVRCRAPSLIMMPGMSASLIGRLGQALSGYPPVQCRCRSRARASLRSRHQGPSIMGFEDEVEQSNGRPCRQCNGRFKPTYELTSYCRRVAQHLHVLHPPRLFLVSVVTASASWEDSWEQFVLLSSL